MHSKNSAWREIDAFHRDIKSIMIRICKTCKEGNLRKERRIADGTYECSRCKRDTMIPKRYSEGNNMDPMPQPEELKELIQIEEMLIARIAPLMRVYTMKGGLPGFSGHCINFPQDIKLFANTLPHLPQDLSVVLVRKKLENKHKDFRVRRKKVEDAINWLRQNNPLWKFVICSKENLDKLPIDGIISGVNVLDLKSPHPKSRKRESESEESEEGEYESVVPLSLDEMKEKDQIRAAIVPWPSSSTAPLSETKIKFIAAMAFPTLFPYGRGDPTGTDIIRDDMSLGAKLKHLINYMEEIVENLCVGLLAILDFHSGCTICCNANVPMLIAPII